MKNKIVSVQQMHSKCLRCGKPLKNIESQLSGYGPECKKKLLLTKLKRISLTEEDR